MVNILIILIKYNTIKTIKMSVHLIRVLYNNQAIIKEQKLVTIIPTKGIEFSLHYFIITLRGLRAM